MDVKEELQRVRRAVREHRDQVGDWRCWVDDEVLYHSVLPELRGTKPSVPPPEVFTSFCEHYFNCRQELAEGRDGLVPSGSSRGNRLTLSYDPMLDGDLDRMNQEELRSELERLQQRVREHSAPGQLGRDHTHDRELYLSLPERKLAMTKLPSREKFLGQGCSSYNRHCQEKPEDFASGNWNS